MANDLLSKVKIGSTVYDLKDAKSRSDLAALLGSHEASALGSAAWKDYEDTVANDGKLPTGAAVQTYVASKIGEIVLIKYEVVTELPAASSTVEFNKSRTIYLKKNGTAGTDVYEEFICVKEGSNYVWEKIGDTKIDLSNYVQKTQKIAGLALSGDIAKADLQTALDLKQLAYKDKADVVAEVTSKTVSGVKATGTSTGEITVTLDQTSTSVTPIKSAYTPAGSITIGGEAQAEGNKVLKGGSISVTLKDNTVSEITDVGTLPTKAADSFTANTPTTIDVSKFNAGSQASYSHTGFSGGSLGDATKSAFATEGLTAHIATGSEITGDVDAETLIFGAASTSNAVTEQGSFTAAVYGTDSFTANTLPSLESGFYAEGTAASFTEGAFSQGTLPTKANKTVAVDSQTFTGTPATLAFAGTEKTDFFMTGATYDKATVNAASTTFTGKAIELSVGDIVVPGQDASIKDKPAS